MMLLFYMYATTRNIKFEIEKNKMELKKIITKNNENDINNNQTVSSENKTKQKSNNNRIQHQRTTHIQILVML